MSKLALSSLSLLFLAACGSSSSEVPAPDAPSGGEVSTTGDAPASGSYDPCAGKSDGDPCKLCAPSDSNCMETMELKVCSAGKCTSQVGEVQ